MVNGFSGAGTLAAALLKAMPYCDEPRLRLKVGVVASVK
jgi:hypothetical protein